MKITVKRPVEIEIKTVHCKLPVRYEEEDIPNNYPHRKNDVWDIHIDADTGQISDWPQGVAPLEMNMKVCDEGSYYLYNAHGNTVWSREQDYVPSFLPGGYGDYIGFRINESGVITNWHDFFTKREVEAYFKQEED